MFLSLSCLHLFGISVQLGNLDAVVVPVLVSILTCQLFLILQWTKEDGQRTSTSAVPNLFVPLNTNPKEVQEMRNKVRAGASLVGTRGWQRWRRQDGMHAASPVRGRSLRCFCCHANK